MPTTMLKFILHIHISRQTHIRTLYVRKTRKNLYVMMKKKWKTSSNSSRNIKKTSLCPYSKCTVHGTARTFWVWLFRFFLAFFLHFSFFSNRIFRVSAVFSVLFVVELFFRCMCVLLCTNSL